MEGDEDLLHCDVEAHLVFFPFLVSRIHSNARLRQLSKGLEDPLETCEQQVASSSEPTSITAYGCGA